jgi:nucleotide-binding universal stress UspA family protein
MKILIAVGGSSKSENALRLGAEIVRCSEEIPVVLTVARHKADQPRAEALLQAAQSLLTDVPCIHTRIRYGRPAEQIVAEAREGGYGLIILGERRDHTFKTLMLGSTGLFVVEHAACPVLIAKGEIKPIRRILLCDSGAIVPSLLARFTAQLAGTLLGQAEITVLHVMSQIIAWPGVPDEDLRASAEELIEERSPEGVWLASGLELLAHPGIRARAKVRHGVVVEEILAESETNGYDLVVIGAHRDAGWQRVLLADIARVLIKRLNRPVLVVR